MSEPAANPSPEGGFVSHLIELRNRLVYALGAVGAVFIVLMIVPGSNQVYAIIAQPLMDVLPAGMSMIATEVASPFLTPLKFTLAAAVTLSIPFLLYQVWAFVAPGLYKHEKHMVMPLVVSSVLLFYTGMAFAYFVVFPTVFKLFVDILPPGVQMMTDIKAYLDFVFSMFFAFGLAFEIPVAVVILSSTGVVNPETLAAKRPYVIVGAFVVAAILTPPDVASQFLLAVPMLILFEVGLFVARVLHRRRIAGDEADHKPLTDTEMTSMLDTYEKENPAGGKRKKRKE
ncbi:MAG TPA: twin-arginine translocase subunit TatC [Acidiferrobacterales bacterium]|nr:twin-arginine translocase subunit TatC [Acidiferrobacterales bacterium]